MDLPELIDDAISSFPKKNFCEIDNNSITIVGDTHADYSALEKILKESKGKIVFLGDYADRGDEPVKVYEKVLQLYLEEKAILLRGNHETTNVYPHELPYMLKKIFGSDEVYKKLQELWEKLPVFAIANDIFLVHGGVPTKGCRIDEEGVKFSELKRLDRSIMLEMMWNDPWERDRCGENHNRGVFFFFGKKATKIFLDEVGCRFIVRSHEPYKVLKVEQNGMVVTVGSCAKPYGLQEFAALFVDFNEPYRDCYEFVEKFGKKFKL